MVDWTNLLREFVTLFVVIDPVGSIPVFLYSVASVPSRLHRRYAVRAVFVATMVLFTFLIAGQFVLETLGLRFGSFQIAGGIILFLFALSMIFGHSKAETEIEEAGKDHLAGAVFPLAMPSIASPGAMLAIVVLTDNHEQALTEQLITAGLLIVIMAFTLILLLAATYVHRIIGNTGASVISRVMGMILATIAIDSIIGGMEALEMIVLPTEQSADGLLSD
ncbi:MarC family protein [Yoonia tamlensis]|uniref:MarC family protein n=1 Tax=Yoonia tamlensis TaxID=390270 RepID=UPI000B7CFD29|nr:MarC family protein [Yoonia tamlensis]